MIRIGLDLSVNSTGVCIRDTEKNECKYVIIAGKLTKKQAAFRHENFEYSDYGKEQPDKNDPFLTRELKKSHNIYNITCEIEKLLKRIKGVKKCTIESISYGSSSSAALADLAGLNYAVRCMLLRNGIEFDFASPMQLKKFAVGNGCADKEMMIDGWKKCQPEFADMTEIKADDIADAYFLSVYEEA